MAVSKNVDMLKGLITRLYRLRCLGGPLLAEAADLRLLLVITTIVGERS